VQGGNRLDIKLAVKGQTSRGKHTCVVSGSRRFITDKLSARLPDLSKFNILLSDIFISLKSQTFGRRER